MVNNRGGKSYGSPTWTIRNTTENPESYHESDQTSSNQASDNFVIFIFILSPSHNIDIKYQAVRRRESKINYNLISEITCWITDQNTNSVDFRHEELEIELKLIINRAPIALRDAIKKQKIK